METRIKGCEDLATGRRKGIRKQASVPPKTYRAGRKWLSDVLWDISPIYIHDPPPSERGASMSVLHALTFLPLGTLSLGCRSGIREKCESIS